LIQMEKSNISIWKVAFQFSAGICLSGITLHIVLVAVFFLSNKGMDTELIDTQFWQNTPYGSEARLALYGSHMLDRPGKNLIFIGASNIRESFRPDQVNRLIPGYNIHNMGLSGANITEIRQTIELISHSISAEKLRESWIIIGLGYLNIRKTETKWPDGRTMIEKEAIRLPILFQEAGLFYGETHHAFLNLIKEQTKHYFNAAKLGADAISYVRVASRRVAVSLGIVPPSNYLEKDKKKPELVVDDVYMKKAIKRRIKQMGGFDKALDRKQIKELSKTIDLLEALQAKYVFLGMPYPSWIRNKVPQFQRYQNEIAKFKAERPDKYIDATTIFSNHKLLGSSYIKPRYFGEIIKMVKDHISSY
jgi:hypothetical protein